MQISKGTFSAKSLIFLAVTVGFCLQWPLAFDQESFVLLLAGSLRLPAPVGSLAAALHLLALIVNGQMATNQADRIISLISTAQLLVIVALYLALASSTTRAYVWTQSPPLVADH